MKNRPKRIINSSQTFLKHLTTCAKALSKMVNFV